MKWYLKQLFPLMYFSKFTSMTNGKTYVTVWRQWLGRTFKQRTFEIVKEVKNGDAFAE